MKIKIDRILFAIFFLSFGLINQAQAFCPVCTVAVGAGLGLCRWLGVDDVLSGIWIGGLLVSMTGWSLTWLDKKKIHFKYRWLAVSAIFYILIIVPFYYKGIMGHPYNKFWGIDKLLLGIIVGSAAFLLAVWFNEFLKKRNQGKVFFPFQKVVLPLVFLAIATYIFHRIVGCNLF
jgi:hypothetical protein